VTSLTSSSAGASATATVASSPYPIIPSAAVGTGLGNYMITYADGQLTVNPAALTIAANAESKTYGQALTFAGTEFTTAGLINGDTVTGVTLTSAGAPATATAASSPYPITPSAAVGNGLGNYTISYIDGTLTVMPPLVELTGVQLVSSKNHRVAQVLVQFSGALNAADAQNLGIYRLTSAGKKGSFTAKNSKVITLRSAAYSAASDLVTLTLNKPFKLSKPVQLLIDGQANSGLEDSLGRLIDGNHDGQPGGNAVAVLSRSGVMIDAEDAGRPDQRSIIGSSVVDIVLEQEGEPPRKRSARYTRAN
jgi:MBG domain (YGX type)